jgi:hypothetical protein
LFRTVTFTLPVAALTGEVVIVGSVVKLPPEPRGLVLFDQADVQETKPLVTTARTKRMAETLLLADTLEFIVTVPTDVIDKGSLTELKVKDPGVCSNTSTVTVPDSVLLGEAVQDTFSDGLFPELSRLLTTGGLT